MTAACAHSRCAFAESCVNFTSVIYFDQQENIMQEPNMIQYIQERINMYAGTPFPNKGSEAMKAYWLEQMDLYKGYLRGEVKRSQLDLDMLGKMSGWTMPEWGYARS